MKLKIVFSIFSLVWLSAKAQLPYGFVYVDDEIPSIKVELRYFSTNNFTGKVVDGYTDDAVILTKQATKALKKIQKQLLEQNLSLKIFDAYRPQRAVNNFWKWAKNVNDTLMKQEYYPNIAKKNLFKEEYIATRSRHSSGSTIDVTIVDLITNKELDMGTPYDYFGPESWVSYEGITKQQKENRMFLQTIMNKNGFRSYPKEWWHFTLRGEPFRNIYFDFIIE
jgi:D-alanyl-D-alanine dipeptidase